MDKFPEAFRRFEQQVPIKGIEDFAPIEIMFSGWAGRKWLPTYKQSLALAREADKRGIRNITIPEWVEKRPKGKQLTAGARYGKRRVRTYYSASGTAKQTRKLSANRVKVLVIHNYVKKGYSSNRIQKELKAQGRGMRRKELLKIVREAKNKQLKQNSNKYTRKKYRKKEVNK